MTVTFRERIEALYLRTGAPSPHGAQRWFAAQAGVTDRAVRRWCAGDRTPSGPVLALLARLEAE